MKGKYESGQKKNFDKRKNSGKTRKSKGHNILILIKVTRSLGFSFFFFQCAWAKNKHHIYHTSFQKKK